MPFDDQYEKRIMFKKLIPSRTVKNGNRTDKRQKNEHQTTETLEYTARWQSECSQMKSNNHIEQCIDDDQQKIHSEQRAK